MPHLDRQAYESLLRHAHKCSTDYDYAWDRESKDRRHAMNACLDLRDALDKLAVVEASHRELVAALKKAKGRMEFLHGDNVFGGCTRIFEECGCALADDYAAVEEALANAEKLTK